MECRANTLFSRRPLGVLVFVPLLLLPFRVLPAPDAASAVQLALGIQTRSFEASTLAAIFQKHAVSDDTISIAEQTSPPGTRSASTVTTTVPQLHDDTAENHTKITITLNKCCPLGQVFFSESGCGENSSLQFSPQLNVHDHNATHINDQPYPAQVVAFVPRVKAIECPHDKYPIFPDENYTLLKNGTLLWSKYGKLYAPDQFCLETVDLSEDDNAKWLTSPIVCFETNEAPTSNIVFYFYAAGVLLSSIFLIATAFVFLLVEEIRDTRGKCVIGYALSMAVAFIILAFAQIIGISDSKCEVFGFVIQFLLVLSFTWLTMLSFETLIKIMSYNKDTYTADEKRFYIYLIFGIVIPIIVFVISFCISKVPGLPSTFLKPKFGQNECWFNHEGKSSVIHFYAPISFLIVINIVLGMWMRILLFRYEKTRQNDLAFKVIKVDLKPMFRACIFVLIVMMLCWVMEIVTYLVNDLGGIGIALDMIDSLQGIFVFVIFVMHRPVNQILKKRREKRRIQRENNAALLVESRTNFNVFEESSRYNGNAGKSIGKSDADHPLINHYSFLTDIKYVDSVEDVTV